MYNKCGNMHGATLKIKDYIFTFRCVTLLSLTDLIRVTFSTADYEIYSMPRIRTRQLVYKAMREREEDHKSGNARTVDKTSVPVYDAAFSRTVDFKFSCDKVLCVCVCLFYHPIYSVGHTFTSLFVVLNL